MSNINLFSQFDNEQIAEQDYHNMTREHELIVFGYSCKLFRDDFSAKAIDRGQNLIPWNGDENLMIDRHDCRGHLSDLTIWDSDFIQTKFIDQNEQILTDDEKQIESQCEQERYMDLYQDIQQQTLRQEEESKRLNRDENTYNQVEFIYDSMNNSKQSDHQITEETQQTLDDDEYEPFYPSEKLQIPYGMDIPESIKLNAVIEKTASFVSTSGVQMEIVLKTKQANNPQFHFLKYDHYLNPYYRHLIIMIKSGKYRANLEQMTTNHNNQKKLSTKNGVDHNSSHDEDEGNDSYLHPILRGGTNNNEQTNSTKKYDETQRIRSVQMNIHDTAYGQLIKKYEHLRQREKIVKENDEEKLSVKPDESSLHSESSSTMVIPPPPDVKPIIDKLAEHVARNGQQFEQMIRTKNDQRFGFIERDHIHYNYYQLKLQLCLVETQRKTSDEFLSNIDSIEQQQIILHDESIKFIFKSTKDKNSMGKSSQEFQSDDESSSSSAAAAAQTNDNEQFIGPRPPSAEFLEKMRKQEQRRDRLNEFVREKIVRNKQEERKRKAEQLIQKLKTQTTSTINNESSNKNCNLIEKLLNIKTEQTLTQQSRSSSKRERSKSKYYRRSTSKSSHRRHRRSSHKRSRTRSKSRTHHRSKRSKNSKSSRYNRSHRRHRRRHSSKSSSSTSSTSTSSSRSSPTTSRSSSSTSTTSSLSSNEKKQMKHLPVNTDENQRRKNPSSSKWDQREPMKTTIDDSLSLSFDPESTISNSTTAFSSSEKTKDEHENNYVK